MEIGWDPLIILLTGYVRRSGTMLINMIFEGILLSDYPSREEAGIVLVVPRNRLYVYQLHRVRAHTWNQARGNECSWWSLSYVYMHSTVRDQVKQKQTASLCRSV